MSSIPGLGRSTGGEHGNPLQYSCVENPMDRASWQATVHRVTKSKMQLKWFSTHAHTYAQMEQLPWLEFTSWVKEVVSEYESMNCVIHRETLASHLNLIIFFRIWLKWSTTLTIHVCLSISGRRWMQSTHVFSYIQKWDSFLEVDHWPGFLSYESCSRYLF